ncbi:hypothetical protein Tco_0917545 [Tanacetum coccineum]
MGKISTSKEAGDDSKEHIIEIREEINFIKSKLKFYDKVFNLSLALVLQLMALVLKLNGFGCFELRQIQ